MTTAEVTSIVQQQLALLLKVRINELPDYEVGGNKISLNDLLPVYRVADNKTVQTSLEVIRALMVNSSDEVLTPKLMGDTFIVTAGPAENESDIFNIPVLANKEFKLRPAGFRALKVDEEYEMLASGGFKLLTRTMVEGEEFEIELIDDSIAVNPGSSAGTTLFTGAITINSSTLLNFTNFGNKLIQLRPTGPVVGVPYVPMATTLPKVEDVPENTVWFFEASLAQYESRIATSNGQYIYINGGSVQEVFLRKGEFLIVYRGADGWYVWAFDPRMTQVGQINYGYSVDDDEIELNGGTYSKTLYPRTWKKITEKFSASLVSEATWQTATATIGGVNYAYPYRGCFADVDANTFRMPDFVESGLRVIGSSVRFSATARSVNQPGGFQKDQVGEINYELHLPRGDNFTGGNNSGRLGKGLDANVSPDQIIQMQINAGQETIMKNIGLKAKMKV